MQKEYDEPMDDEFEDDFEVAQTPSIFLVIFKFFKKHWLPTVITLGVIIILFVIFSLIPVISLGDTKIVNLGSPVRLEQGQTAKLKGDSASVVIVHFSNDTCPAGETCFGSDTKAVEYELTIDGQDYATGSLTKATGSKYQIKTLDSDYTTYAEIEFVKSE